MARKIRRGWPGEDPGWKLAIAGRTSIAYFRVSDNPDDTEQRSVSDQVTAYKAWQGPAGVIPGETYADDDRSASEFAHREREDIARLRADIGAGNHDGAVLWFWSCSRLTRGDISIDLLARECIAHGIVWAVAGRVLNPACDEDLSIAEQQNLADKQLPRTMRKDVKRGKASAALAGTPAAVPLYGYRRVYRTDERGPVLVKGRPVIEGDEPVEPAASVVREIFARLETGATLSQLRAELEDRRVPAPRRPRKCTSCGEPNFGRDRPYGCPRGHEQDLCQWHPSAVRFIATNVGYLGKRIFQAESGTVRDRRKAVLDGVVAKWPPLVSERQFYAVQNILANGGRSRWRGSGNGGNPGSSRQPAAHPLMVPAARCGGCGGALGAHVEQGRLWYKCRVRGCSSVRADWLDDYADNRLVSWLVLPEVRAELFGSRADDDARNEAAEAELAKAQGELAELAELAEAGELSPKVAAALDKAIRVRITAAEGKIKVPTGPVYAMLGPQAAGKWWTLRTESPAAAAQLMAVVATVYVNPAASRGGGVHRGFDESRVEWHWSLGPEASVARTRTGASAALAERKQKLAAGRDRAAQLLTANPALADAAAGRQAGISYGAVAKVRAELLAAGTITDPGYRAGRDGKRYRVVDDPRRVTGRARVML